MWVKSFSSLSAYFSRYLAASRSLNSTRSNQFGLKSAFKLSAPFFLFGKTPPSIWSIYSLFEKAFLLAAFTSLLQTELTPDVGASWIIDFWMEALFSSLESISFRKVSRWGIKEVAASAVSFESVIPYSYSMGKEVWRPLIAPSV